MKIAIIIGTYRENTLKQIDYLIKNGIKIKDLNDNEINDISLYKFKLDTDYKKIDYNYINKLLNYDYLIISGGETAFYILNKSDFLYIENKSDIMPLISKGIIKGGILNNKKIVLKGGNIGNEDIYLKIINCIKINSF